MIRLGTAFTVMLALLAPGHAETNDAAKLRSAGEQVAFVVACPKHFERLPPRTQRLAMDSGDRAASVFGKDAVREAALAAYGEGYYKQGERWCESMQSVLDYAGRF